MCRAISAMSTVTGCCSESMQKSQPPSILPVLRQMSLVVRPKRTKKVNFLYAFVAGKSLFFNLDCKKPNVSELKNHSPKLTICASVSSLVKHMGDTLAPVWVRGGSFTSKTSPKASHQLGNGPRFPGRPEDRQGVSSPVSLTPASPIMLPWSYIRKNTPDQVALWPSPQGPLTPTMVQARPCAGQCPLSSSTFLPAVPFL